MKRILIGLLFISNLCLAQSDTVISYTEVVTVPGTNKDELFVRARQWFNETFKSSKHVLQIADKESGELAANGIFYATISYRLMGNRSAPFEVYFTANIWSKNEKYKYEFSNFRVEGYETLTSAIHYPVKIPMASQKKADDFWNNSKQGVEKEVLLLAASLKNAMQQKPKNDF